MKAIKLIAAAVMMSSLLACSKGPEPIRWGTDTCDQCRMILCDKRFGAELVADRVYKFDGIDELAKFQAAHPEKKGAAYVSDGQSGAIIPAGEALFVASHLRGPMGGLVMSFAKRDDAERFVAQYGLREARFLSFKEALAQGGDHAGD